MVQRQFRPSTGFDNFDSIGICVELAFHAGTTNAGIRFSMVLAGARVITVSVNVARAKARARASAHVMHHIVILREYNDMILPK